MRAALDDLFRRTSMISIAAGIALGWSFVQLAEGAARLVMSALVATESSSSVEGQLALFASDLSLRVGNRLLEFGSLINGLIVFGLTLLAIRYVVAPARRSRP